MRLGRFWRGHFLWLSSCMSFIRHHKARLPELSSSPYQLQQSSPYAFLRFSENKVPRLQILLHLTCLGYRRGIELLNNKKTWPKEK